MEQVKLPAIMHNNKLRNKSLHTSSWLRLYLSPQKRQATTWNWQCSRCLSRASLANFSGHPALTQCTGVNPHTATWSWKLMRHSWINFCSFHQNLMTDEQDKCLISNLTWTYQTLLTLQLTSFTYKQVAPIISIKSLIARPEY